MIVNNLASPLYGSIDNFFARKPYGHIYNATHVFKSIFYIVRTGGAVHAVNLHGHMTQISCIYLCCAVRWVVMRYKPKTDDTGYSEDNCC